MRVPVQRRLITQKIMWGGLIMCVALIVSIPTVRADNLGHFTKPVINLVTLDWPPYSTVNLPDGGLLSRVVTAAFDQVDIDHTIEVYPWKRALLNILNNRGFEAIFPLCLLYTSPSPRDRG